MATRGQSLCYSIVCRTDGYVSVPLSRSDTLQGIPRSPVEHLWFVRLDGDQKSMYVAPDRRHFSTFDGWTSLLLFVFSPFLVLSNHFFCRFFSKATKKYTKNYTTNRVVFMVTVARRRFFLRVLTYCCCCCGVWWIPIGRGFCSYTSEFIIKVSN